MILKNNKILNYQDPIYNYKSIKSNKEIKNIKLAHLQDGVAVTKFLFWLKKILIKKRLQK